MASNHPILLLFNEVDCWQWGNLFQPCMYVYRYELCIFTLEVITDFIKLVTTEKLLTEVLTNEHKTICDK